MKDALKKLAAMCFGKQGQQDYAPGSNMHFIEKYKELNEAIATWYQAEGRDGNIETLDGIVTPLKIDNRQMFSVIDNQGQTPHCAAYSIAGIVEALIWKRTGKLLNLDASQIYAKAKEIDGDIHSDGTSLDAAIKAAMKLGGLGEHSGEVKLGFFYPNGCTPETLEVKVKRLLHKYDFLHAGFMITDGWYKCSKWSCRIQHGSTCYGGHAVVIVGADTEGAYIANSWGQSWGAKGFAVMPWEVVQKELLYACYLQNCFNRWCD